MTLRLSLLPFPLGAAVAPALALALALALAPAPAAQVGPADAGLQLIASSSGGFGTLCRGFSCTPLPAQVMRGENVTLEVRGRFGGVFAIGFAPATPYCLTIPPILNRFVIGPTIPVEIIGVMDQGDPILSCPGGVGTFAFRLPSLPTPYRFAVQAVAETVAAPQLTFAFTQALLVDVQ